MTEASVVAVGTPQSFRQQIARALEVETEEIGWAQSATVAEELLINAFTPIDVLVLSPEVKEPDALGLAEFVGRQSPGTAIVLVRDHTWNGLLPAAMRAGIRDVVDMTQGNEELRDAVERAVVWATNLRSMGGGTTESSSQERGHIISVFSSKGGSGKTFLTTNLAAAIADITDQDTAVVDLDADMGDVFTYFGREPSARVDDLMGLGEGRRSRSDPRDRRPVRRAPLGLRLTAGPRGRAARRRGRWQVPADAPRGLLVRRGRRVRGLLGLGARLLRPVRRDLPGHAARRGRREAPLEGARHAAHDRAPARAVPRGAEPRRQQGRVGLDRRGARHEDHGGRHDPVEPARSDVAEQGTPGRAGRAQLRRLDSRPAARRAVHRSFKSPVPARVADCERQRLRRRRSASGSPRTAS